MVLTNLFIKKLNNDIRRFRNSPYIKKHITGGLSVIECGHPSDSRGWNLHVHCIVRAVYIDQKIISREWKKATGDSYIVDIRRVGSSELSLNYLFKYLHKAPVVKSSRGSFWISILKWAYNKSFYKSRHVNSWGSLRPVVNDQEEENPYHLKCPACGQTNWISDYRLGLLGGWIKFRPRPGPT